MRLSRREFLAAAATTVVAAGCSVRPGSDSGTQVVPAEQVPSEEQVLDPNLILSLPSRAVAPETITQFARTNSVRVAVKAQGNLDRFLLGLSAGGEGTVDIALVDQATLEYMIDEQLVESVDNSLIPNRRLLSSPFSDPPYDSGSAHSIAKDYTVVGYATAVPGILPEDTWRGFFRLAKLSPKRVVVPDDAENVIGAVMLALGHSWSSSSASDLADARRFLLDLRHALVVAGDVNRFRLGNFLAAMSSGLGFRHPELGIRFVVPKDGAVISMRSYCIPALAPDPVTAHAWLNDTLAPQIVRQDVVFSERASPVVEANFVIPSEILINPAIYPPAEVSDGLQFSTVSDAGAAARSALWAEVRPS